MPEQVFDKNIVFNSIAENRDNIERIAAALNPNRDTTKSTNPLPLREHMQAAVNCGLTCYEGLEKSALIAMSEDAPVIIHPNALANHIFKEASRAVNIAENPNSYMPRSVPLYDISGRKWQPLCP